MLTGILFRFKFLVKGFRFWLGFVAVFSLILVFGQNCSRVKLIDTTVQSVQATQRPIILAPMEIIELTPNSAKTFSLSTEEGSSPIEHVAFDDARTVFNFTTSNLSQVQINSETNEIIFTPNAGFQGMDQVDFIVFGEDQKPVQTSAFFVVRNPTQELPEINALVYGAEDQDAMQDKLMRRPPPGMIEIFTNWARFSDGLWFPTGVVPAGNAASWMMLQNPDRISCSINSKEYTGFVSLTSFETYDHQAILTSPNEDDDAITLIIAFVREGGKNYTLSAVRTAGGTAPMQGWGILYAEDGVRKKTFSEKSVDGVRKTGAVPVGSPVGWSNFKSMVRVERRGDVVEARTSNWHTSESFLFLDPTSLIRLDLNSDPVLAKFKGPKPYGYGSHSQADTTFLNVQFSTGLNDRFVYDLAHNLVFELVGENYILRSDVDAYTHLGYPRRVGNPDTGKVFQLYQNKTYLPVR